MSVRVNLLPQESKRDAQQSTQRGIAAGVFVLFLAGLGGLYFFQQGQIGDAEDTLAAEQATLTGLQQREGQLSPYAELQARATVTVERVETALGQEVSFAGVLQDIATVFPPEAELNTIAIAFGEERVASLGGTRPVIGTLAVSGSALRGHAPGLERLLLALDTLGSLDNTFATSSSLDPETGVSTFSVTGEFGTEARTNRYVDLEIQELR
jgi:Tfp pilus assembly protein PilN